MRMDYWSGKQLEWDLSTGESAPLLALADLYNEAGHEATAAWLRLLPELADEALNVIKAEGIAGRELGPEPGEGWFMEQHDGDDGWPVAMTESLKSAIGTISKISDDQRQDLICIASRWLTARTGLRVRPDLVGVSIPLTFSPVNDEVPFHFDVPLVARMYGIPVADRPYVAVEEDLLKAARHGCPVEVVMAVIGGADYPITHPPEHLRAAVLAEERLQSAEV